jgi:hypothetical protein
VSNQPLAVYAMHRREKFCEALEILVIFFFGPRVARAKTRASSIYRKPSV